MAAKSPITVSWLLFVGLAFCLGSCSSSRKLTAPAVSIQLPDSLPPLPVSEIDIPLKVAGHPLLAMADTLVPREFISAGWPGYFQPSCDFRYKYRFVRSGYTLSCTNNTIRIQMHAGYQVAGSKCLCALGKPISPWASGSCGFGDESLRRVDISMSSQLSFLPNYTIRTRTQLDQLRTLDKCTVSILSSDITRQITDSIRTSIITFCSLLDHTVAGLNFSASLHQASVKAGQSTSIGPYGYLSLNPQSIRIGQLNYIKDTFQISLGISCKPVLSDDSNSHAKPLALPPLSNSDNRNGLSLWLQVSYDYAFISKMINDSLRNRSFTFKGRTVVVKEVNMKGIGHHQVEIRIDFEGDKKGRVYLRGTPVLDTAKQALSVPDISYSLESKDLVLKMARTLLRSKIRRSLQGSTYLDLAALLKANLPTLNAQLNRQLAPNIYSAGSIRQIRMTGLLPLDKQLQARLYINASLAVTGTGLPFPTGTTH